LTQSAQGFVVVVRRQLEPNGVAQRAAGFDGPLVHLYRFCVLLCVDQGGIQRVITTGQ